MNFNIRKCPEGYDVEDMAAWAKRRGIGLPHLCPNGEVSRSYEDTAHGAFTAEQARQLAEYLKAEEEKEAAKREEAIRRGNFMYFALRELDSERKHWGDNNFWTEQCVLGIARKINTQYENFKRRDRGEELEPIEMFTESRYESGFDIEEVHYTDGTVKNVYYSAD